MSTEIKTMKKVTEQSLVRQDNRLINFRGGMSANELKVLEIFIASLHPDDEENTTYITSVKEIQNLLKVERKDIYKAVDDITDGIMEKVLKFDLGGGDWIKTHWLYFVQYRHGKGEIAWKMEKTIKDLLVNLKSHFTQYQLGNILSLKNKYAIRIYRIGRQYVNMGRHKIDYDIEELRSIFGIQEGQYKVFQDFKKRVLVPAEKEINSKTDLIFSWDSIRHGQGGKIIGLRFNFSDKRDAIRSSAKKDKEDAAEVPSILTKLRDIGWKDKFSRKTLDEYGEAKIREKLSLLEQAYGVKNKGAWLRRALEQDYTSSEIAENKQDKVRQQQRVEKEKEIKKQQRIAEQQHIVEVQELLEKYMQLTKQEKGDLEQEFRASPDTKLPVMQKQLRKMEHVDFHDKGMIGATYRSFLKKKLADR